MTVSFYDKLQKQKDGIQRYHQYEDQINDLSSKLKILSEEILTNEQTLQKEAKDVEQLTGKSVQSLYHRIRGNYDSQLEKEMQERHEAELQLDFKKQELERLQLDIQTLQKEQSLYYDCQRNYDQLFQYRLKELISNNSPNPKTKELLLSLQNNVDTATSQKKELEEAILAGERVNVSLNQAYDHLKSASNWGTFDIFGGGLITDIAKHSKIDDARSSLAKAQRDLRAFRTELADVSMNISISIDIGSFTTFADYFFDDIFSSISVKSKITDAQNNVSTAIKQVRSTLILLERSKLEKNDHIENTLEQIKDIVIHSD